MIAKIEPAIIIQLVREQSFFRFAKTHVRVKLGFHQADVRAEVVAVVDESIIMVNHRGYGNRDAVQGLNLVTRVKLYPAEGCLASRIGTFFTHQVEITRDLAMLETNNTTHPQFRLGLAYPFLPCFEISHRF